MAYDIYQFLSELPDDVLHALKVSEVVPEDPAFKQQATYMTRMLHSVLDGELKLRLITGRRER